jgi:recombination protein RecA
VDVDNLLVSQPDTGEQALEIAEVLIRSNAVDVVVIDSVAALVPRAEIEGEMGDTHVGLQARLMSQALRKLTGAVNRSNTAVIFTNQIREKVGRDVRQPRDHVGRPGAQVLRLRAPGHPAHRRDQGRSGRHRQPHAREGREEQVRAALPQAEFDIQYNEGVSHNGLLIDLGVEHRVVDKSGSWFSYGDLRLGQGKENAKQFLGGEPRTSRREVEAAVKSALGIAGEASGRKSGSGGDTTVEETDD